MDSLPYAAFDADNHFYEPRDCFTRYIEPRYKDEAVHTRPRPDGGDEIWIGDEPFGFLRNRSFERVVKPGRLREMLRQSMYAKETADEQDFIEAIQPAYQDREERLLLMDHQGLEGIVIFPTVGVTVEQQLSKDAGRLYANLHSFNRWLEETWGFSYKDRIIAPPLISMLELDRAVQQLDWALERGARLISLRPGPFYGRHPADPYFDPFWSRVDEAGIGVAFHITESGYNEMMSVHYGENPNPSSHEQSALQWTCFYGDRPIMDTMAALVFGNLFGRYPNIRVLSVENGSLWAPYLMRSMDKMGGMGRNGPWIGGRIEEKPSAIFRRHVFIAPHHTGDDVEELIRLMGHTQVLFGSDFPHAEGMSAPIEFATRLDHLPGDQVRDIMRENTRRLVGLA